MLGGQSAGGELMTERENTQGTDVYIANIKE